MAVLRLLRRGLLRGGRRVNLELVPITIKEANRWVKRLHRHHGEAHGALFAIGAAFGDEVVAVAITGRPVAGPRDDGWTAEVVRLCSDGARNACSFLYGASARAAWAMGYLRIGTYILDTETGVSLKAAGWKYVGERGGGSWKNRPGRNDAHPLTPKGLYELVRPGYADVVARKRIPAKVPVTDAQERLAV